MTLPGIDPDAITSVAAATFAILEKVLPATGITHHRISKAKVLEVAECLVKDISRLIPVQHNQIADSKYAAYWAFWIRKLKPVTEAWIVHNGHDVEVTDINERAALEFAIATLKNGGKHANDLVRGQCNLPCDGAACIDKYLTQYFQFANNHYSEYIVYSLGKRTFGPHHLCAVLDSFIFASCSRAQAAAGSAMEDGSA